MIIKTTKLFKILILIVIKVKNHKVVGNNSLKLNLFKFRRIKKIKSKNLAKWENLVNLFKFQITNIINIKAIKYLIFETRITFIWLRQTFTKALIL